MRRKATSMEVLLLTDTGWRKQKMNMVTSSQKLEICPEEAETVKIIFTLYVQKALGAKKIAQILNEQGIKRRNGKKWTKDNILSILQNPIYKGERIFNRYDSKTRKEKPQDEWIRIKD